jgi:hypothetical protein
MSAPRVSIATDLLERAPASILKSRLRSEAGIYFLDS